MFKKKKTIVFLLSIVLLGSFLRLYKLDKFPPSLFGDEVDVGYQAYSILKTGKDYLGQKWPISFHSIADWRTPLFLYADVPFVAFFGLNEWGVRLPAALFGILTIPAIYFLAKFFFKDEKIGLLSALCLVLSMWHLQYSRAAFEVTQMLFFLIVGLCFFFLGLEKEKFLSLSAVFLALAPYSYSTAKFFLPILLVFLTIIFFRKLKKISRKSISISIFLLFILLLPMGYDIFFGKAADRFSILSVFSDPTVIPQVGFDRQTDLFVETNGQFAVGTSPSFLSRVFHNKFLSWSTALIRNYFRVFSTEFLFTNGDINYRHSVQGGLGEFYWLDAVFVIIGFYYLFFKHKNAETKKFLLCWLFFSPIPSVLTRDGGNHATRLILILPPLLILIALGINCFLQLMTKKHLGKIIIAVVFLGYLGQFFIYLHRYYIHYPLDSEEWWHCGYKEIASYIKENENEYDYIVISDQDQPPLIFLLFWLKIDPKIPQNNKLQWTEISDAVSADNIPQTKYYIGHVSEERIKANGFIGTLKPNILYFLPGSEIGKDFRYEPVPNSIKLLKTIYYPSGRVAKYIMSGT